MQSSTPGPPGRPLRRDWPRSYDLSPSCHKSCQATTRRACWCRKWRRGELVGIQHRCRRVDPNRRQRGWDPSVPEESPWASGCRHGGFPVYPTGFNPSIGVRRSSVLPAPSQNARELSLSQTTMTTPLFHPPLPSTRMMPRSPKPQIYPPLAQSRH
ncbi:hypothetical protein GMDG_08177 [Pseudogymnoascus destructans 20631-21]|uniref:Uncharacterized protein n=1 Tax=Pseudogymnoascus destructans (strain ATCC MYA-4855 / 20631-21) TaxID=658429 RepID=L8G2N6_PSED2|nr:hypothetical protein GMDG_08177 [Pseudogymnoascus destructans 20631-21]